MKIWKALCSNPDLLEKTEIPKTQITTQVNNRQNNVNMWFLKYFRQDRVSQRRVETWRAKSTYHRHFSDPPSFDWRRKNRTKPGNNKNEDVSLFGIYLWNIDKNICTELMAFALVWIIVKTEPPEPLRPQIQIYSELLKGPLQGVWAHGSKSRLHVSYSLVPR